MNIYAIGDLHLSSTPDKSMDKFGWLNHEKRIFDDWKTKVNNDDIVIIAGDISWALKYEEAILDLEKIAKQKGKKILIKGNHDFWWTSIKKLSTFDKTMFFIQNNIYELDDYVICGTRGWICPNDITFDENDEKLYNRESIRLKNNLELARQTGKQIILILHFPPTNDKKEISNSTNLINEYGVKIVIYGHLHGKNSFDASYKGIINNTYYHLVSCDYLDFKLKKII